MTAPNLLSLGAGVQSTTLALLSAEGRLPKLDGAIFADTGWEPRAVYDHLDRLEREVLIPAGIPLYRVSKGNLRTDSLDPAQRFVKMPTHMLSLEGKAVMARRQCTREYKVAPVNARVRETFLGGVGRQFRTPRGRYASMWIGISKDEAHRAGDSRVQYVRNVFPLLGIGVGIDGDLDNVWTRDDCLNYLGSRGWGSTPKSACIGCPFHHNGQWRDLRDNHPDEWADAVEFDAALRDGTKRGGFVGEMFLHRSRVPLALAAIDDGITYGAPRGCSPYDCPTDEDAA